MSIFIASLDLGQVNDYAALVITEARGTVRKVSADMMHPELRVMYTADRFVEMMPLVQLDVRHVERFDLGTKYAVVAQQMRQRILHMPGPRYFVLDRTGVGMGAVELFAEMSPIGITFTAGEAERSENTPAGINYWVPKRNLVNCAQLLLQNHIMRIAKGCPFAEILGSELAAFKMKISLSGHDTYEAWRERDHDDLVNALAMACWLSEAIISTNALGILGQQRREDPPTISPY